MAKVSVRNVLLRYGSFTAVDNVSLEVADGEYCVLLGPSGCGKTSLLRAIAGLVRPTAGQIFLGDQEITHLYPGDRNIAMIFQNYALYPHLTVRGNFSFPLQALKMPRDQIARRVHEVAALLHMEELLDRYPRELSGGQQQRVAVGRALVRRPALLLLDEPLGNLDAKLRVEMRANLKKLQRDTGITAIHVTHDQVEAQALGDKIVVMSQGEIQQTGSPEEVYELPRNLFVADFVGTPSMNFIQVTVQQAAGRWELRNSHYAVPVPGRLESTVAALGPGAPLVLGARPEYVALYEQQVPGAIPGKVYVLEPQSNEVIVDVSVGEQILKVRADKGRLDFRPQPDQDVYMVLAEDRMQLFDPASTRRLA